MARVKDNPFSYWIKGGAWEAWAETLELPTTDGPPELVWVDLETTGLKSDHEVTLSAGILLTDKFGRVVRDGAADWLVYDSDKDTPHQRKSWDARFTGMEPFVRDMHKKNGLTKALQMALLHPDRDRLHPAGVGLDMYDWLNERFGWGDRPTNIRDRVPMSGSTPHFDRPFVAADLPILDTWFHYRVGVDVSALREQAKLINPGVIETQPEKAEAHLPIPDLVDSVRLYRHLLENFLMMDEDTWKEFAK